MLNVRVSPGATFSISPMIVNPSLARISNSVARLPALVTLNVDVPLLAVVDESTHEVSVAFTAIDPAETLPAGLFTVQPVSAATTVAAVTAAAGRTRWRRMDLRDVGTGLGARPRTMVRGSARRRPRGP